MNASNHSLQTAKKRQKRLYLFAFIGIAGCLIATIAVLGALSGTSVDVLPEDAKASIKLQSGTGFMVESTVYALTNDPVISVSADGFRILQRTIHANETGSTIQVRLEELPGRIVVTTNAAHPKTQWIINSRNRAISAELEIQLDAGDFILEVDSPFFQRKRLDITINRGQEKRLNVTLEPVLGMLNITSQPAGATVRLNDQDIGATPLRIQRNGGRYSIEVARPGYQAISESIAITNNQSIIDRNYKLKRKMAFLNFDLKPARGDLLLNGKKIEPQGPYPVKSQIANILTYSKRGYFPETQTISVAPEQGKTISFRLRHETGTLDVRSTPNATVYVDGKAIGATPRTITLSAVPHRISLTKLGYRTIKKTITPSSATVRKIDVTLRTEMQARLAEAPTEYRNSAGIELKLFKPSKFSMGAPRREQGQRANEFQRKINLRKPFYVGKSEVTNEQFAKFSNNSAPAQEPVASIRWLEAASFCNWLSEQEGLETFYRIQGGRLRGVNTRSDGYRLLSEAEWEWLARKASRPKQTKFPWGDKPTVPPMIGNIADEYAKGQVTFYVPNYSDGFTGVAPVANFVPGVSGLYDLAGNVSEWVHDYYSLIPPKANTLEVDPLGPLGGDLHVVKGSNWRSGTLTELRAAFREGAINGADDIGFRVARYLYAAWDYK